MQSLPATIKEEQRGLRLECIEQGDDDSCGPWMPRTCQGRGAGADRLDLADQCKNSSFPQGNAETTQLGWVSACLALTQHKAFSKLVLPVPTRVLKPRNGKLHCLRHLCILHGD